MEIDVPPGLTARVLEVGPEPADDAEVEPLVTGWMQSLHRGFQEKRATEAVLTHWRAQLRTDRTRLIGLWDRPAVADATMPVATFSEWDGQVQTGADPDGVLPLHMITDVTVAATHRRRGLLRSMMTASLRDAADRGLPLAGLTVSEGSIYGRFGFGLATGAHHVEVDTSARFALRDPATAGDGRVEMAEPEAAWPVAERVYDRFWRRTRGATTRPAAYADWFGGRFDAREDGPDPRLRAALHLDAAGEPDGYVYWRYQETPEKRTVVEVVDLVAEGAAYLRLWRFLADLDLVEQVRYDRARVEGDPLAWALTDPLVRRVTKVDDMLWLRVLDVPTALAARPWAADGTTTLRVGDALGIVDGRYRIETSRGRADVTRLDQGTDPDDVVLDVETLGSLHLGAVTVGTLRAAGRVGGPDSAVATWAAQCGPAGPTGHTQSGF